MLNTIISLNLPKVYLKMLKKESFSSMHEFCTSMYFSKTVNTETVSFIHIPRYIFLSIYPDSQFRPYSQIYIFLSIYPDSQFHPYSQIYILIHIPRQLVSSIFQDIYSYLYKSLSNILIIPHIFCISILNLFHDKISLESLKCFINITIESKFYLFFDIYAKNI